MDDSLTLPPVVLDGRLTVEQLFSGPEYESIRQNLIANGEYTINQRSGASKVVSVRTRLRSDGEHELLAMGAVSRAMGTGYDYVGALQDFRAKTQTQGQKVPLFWEVYQTHGLINNAVNKQAGIIASNGEFLLRRARKGKTRDALDKAHEILHWWGEKVNAPTFDPRNQEAVITGARGLQSVTRQACRVALVEGSWVARHTWQSVEVPGIGAVDLPMTVTTITTAQLTPVLEVYNTVAELFYWTPPQTLLRQLRSPSSKELGNIFKKLLPKDMVKVLMKENKVQLDPSLLLHVKHRGRDGQSFGESAILCALPAVAYEQSILQLDVVSMQNLINRLTIIMVGSDDPESPYSREEVALARASLMQQFFEDPGPNMSIVWAGQDVSIKDVGAHTSILDLNQRLILARDAVREAMGVPVSLLSGTMNDSKSAGWASAMGIRAQVSDLVDQLQNIWTAIGEQILLENGFTDLSLEYRFDPIAMDQNQERMLSRQEYVSGLRSIRATLRSSGLEPDLEFQQKCLELGLDPDTTLWSEAFAPVQGLPGQGPNGGAPGTGRIPNDQTGKPTPPSTERTTTPKKAPTKPAKQP